MSTKPMPPMPLSDGAQENLWQRFAPKPPTPKQDGRTIIDADIDAYTGFMESHQSEIRRCTPDQETAANARFLACSRLLTEMKKYRSVMQDTADITEAMEGIVYG